MFPPIDDNAKAALLSLLAGEPDSRGKRFLDWLLHQSNEEIVRFAEANAHDVTQQGVHLNIVQRAALNHLNTVLPAEDVYKKMLPPEKKLAHKATTAFFAGTAIAFGSMGYRHVYNANRLEATENRITSINREKDKIMAKQLKPEFLKNTSPEELKKLFEQYDELSGERTALWNQQDEIRQQNAGADFMSLGGLIMMVISGAIRFGVSEIDSKRMSDDKAALYNANVANVGVILEKLNRGLDITLDKAGPSL